MTCGIMPGIGGESVSNQLIVIRSTTDLNHLIYISVLMYIGCDGVAA